MYCGENLTVNFNEQHANSALVARSVIATRLETFRRGCKKQQRAFSPRLIQPCLMVSAALSRSKMGHFAHFFNKTDLAKADAGGFSVTQPRHSAVSTQIQQIGHF